MSLPPFDGFPGQGRKALSGAKTNIWDLLILLLQSLPDQAVTHQRNFLLELIDPYLIPHSITPVHRTLRQTLVLAW